MDIKHYTNSIISIYEIGEENFRLGLLVCTNENYSIINQITTRGYEDGLYCVATDNIIRVDYKDRYSKVYMELFKNTHQKFISDFIPDTDLLLSTLNYALNNSYYVSIEQDNSERLTGKILSFSTETITLELYNAYGENDGFSELQRDSITRLWCNTGNERNIQLLSTITY